MGVSCLFGHKWNGCKCEKCGKTRNEGHDFKQEEGKCSEKCTICGQTRTIEHQWDGCKCTRCGETRATGHKWEPIPDKCMEKCSVCGQTRQTEHKFKTVKEDGKTVQRCEKCGYTQDITGGRFQPYNGGGVCDVCNNSLNGLSAWIVPNNVFYNSRKYRDYVNEHGPAAMFGIRMSDADFARMQAQDHSPGSAVCENCIHLF